LEQGVPPEHISDAPIFRAIMRMGEEIPEGDWERFSELDRELSATVRRLAEDQQRTT